MRVLKLLRAVPCRFNVREFHASAGVCSKFHEGNVKSGYQKPDPRSPKERVRDGLHQLKDEIKLWKHEVKEKLEMDIPFIRPGIPDKLWSFQKPDDVKDWICSTDADNGEGYSNARFHVGANGTGIFEGALSTKVPKEGRVKNTGYCAIRTKRARKSFQRETYWDWMGYTHVVMKVRGDGRSYVLNLGAAGHFDIMWNDMYQFILYTRGGPHWQYSKIPFSKFFNASKGRIQDAQFPMHLAFVSQFGIALGDKSSGPFRLEIDWIGLEYDPKHNEDFAYEMYQTDKYVAHH